MLTLGRMALAGGDGKGLLALSIVGWFSRLPWLEYAAGSVVPPVCHLALVAARALFGVIGEDAQMILGSPPFHVSQQVWSLLCRGPASTGQRRYPMTDGQVHPFNKGSIQPSRKAHPRPRGLESGFCPQAHHVRDTHQLAPPIAFFHLTIAQARRQLPIGHFPPSRTSCEPVTKLGREGIKVAIEAITGKEWEAKRRRGSVAGSG